MGYIVFKNSREEDEELSRDSEVESVVGEDAKAIVEEMKLTPAQKKTLLKLLLSAVKSICTFLLRKF